MRLDYYQIYYATVPESFTESYLEDRINQKFYLPRIAKTLIKLYQSKPIKDDIIQITALNGQYMIHPGVHRWVIGKLTGQVIKAYIVNRYGTSYETIQQTFPDAILYQQSMNSIFCFKDKVEDSGHFFYLKKQQEKTQFDDMVKWWDFDFKHGLPETDCIWKFSEKVLELYTDYKK